MRQYTKAQLFPSHGTRVTVVKHDYDGDAHREAAECWGCGALVTDELTHVLWHNNAIAHDPMIPKPKDGP